MVPRIDDLGHGRGQIDLKNWLAFYELIHEEFLDYRSFVFRGHRSSDWKLESTFDRLETAVERSDLAGHLENFQRAARGRRGANPVPIPLDAENDWWALGQHHGLATPLLDWTTSPFVAAFFAFADAGGRDQTERRVIFALSIPQVTRKSEELKRLGGNGGYIEFFRPMSDENPRLLNQSGLFSRIHGGVDLESWIIENFPKGHPYHVLVRITIPDSDREECIRALNRMNINHLSLFPDLHGASIFCNTAYMIDKY